MISRRAHTATLSVMAGVFVVSGGLTGAALAEAHGYHLLRATNGCAVRPAAGTQVVSLITTSPRAAASPSATSSTSPATTSPPATATPTPSPTPKPTTTSAPTTSPVTINSSSPSPTTQTTPTPTPTPTPSQTPTPPPKPAKLCVLVEPFSSNKVQPRHTADFKIFVWSTVAEAQKVTVTATLGHAAHVDAPRFTVCPAPNRAVCTVGTLPTGQSEELIVGAFVRRAASAGERITLTATARGAKAGSSHSAATIKVIAASTPSPQPTVPANPIPPGELPPVPIGELTSPNGNPSGLFPTVGPGGSSSPSAANGRARGLNRSNARDVSATLPLDTRLIGGQLAGLAVLATAIAIAIVRLSLRAPRPHDGGDATK